MHTVRREIQSPRYRVLRHRLFHAPALPEVRKHKDTARQPVWETDGRDLPWDLGEDGETEINIKKDMNNNVAITPAKVLEMAKNGWDAIVEMYKQSSPEQRDKILKILGGLAGFGTLLKYLKSL